MRRAGHGRRRHGSRKVSSRTRPARAGLSGRAGRRGARNWAELARVNLIRVLQARRSRAKGAPAMSSRGRCGGSSKAQAPEQISDDTRTSGGRKKRQHFPKVRLAPAFPRAAIRRTILLCGELTLPNATARGGGAGDRGAARGRVPEARRGITVRAARQGAVRGGHRRGGPDQVRCHAAPHRPYFRSALVRAL